MHESSAVAVLLAISMALSGCMSDVIFARDPLSPIVVVNRRQKLSHTYVPEVLVQPDVRIQPGKEKNVQMRPEAAGALEALFAAAEADGITLYAVSGYRSYASQSILFRGKVDSVGEQRAMLTVAQPGTSEHQLGLTMDVNGATTLREGLVQAFAASPEGTWVAQNAHRFGFVIRYPQNKTKVTGYAWEPWHLRYVGFAFAERLFSLGITLEEYHLALQQRRLTTEFLQRQPQQ